MHSIGKSVLLSLGLLMAAMCSAQAQKTNVIKKKRQELKNIKNDSLKAILYGDIAFEFLNSNFDSAGYYADKALQAANNSGSKYVLADALSVNGTIARYQGKFKSSISFYEKSLAIRISIKDSTGIFRIYGNIGNLYLALADDAHKALEYYFKSLEIQKKLKLQREIAVSYINISSIYLEQKNFLNALSYLQKAEYIAEKHKDYITLGKACLNIGELYVQINQYEQGENYFKKSLQYKRESGDSTGVANSLTNLAALYETTGKIDKALEVTRHILEIREAIGDSLGITESLSNLAIVYMHKGDLSLARQNIEKAIQMSNDLNYSSGLATSFKVKGELLLTEGNYAQAVVFCKKSYDYWKEHQSIEEVANTCKCLYQSFDKLNNPLQAYRYFKEFHQLKEEIKTATKISETVRQQTKYEYEKQLYEDSLTRAVTDERRELKRIEEERASSQKIYMQRWIILLGSLFFILALVGVWYVFKSNKAKQKALFQQKITETELMALRAQMNPHFIFNCLSSIQNCVDKNDFANADKYLGKFSKLLRTSLNTSRKPFISLSEEINYLTLYMELESMRMNHKFDFHFNISNQIDAENTSLPVMILQPFIENSIKHGIAPLTQPGRVDVSIKREEKQLVMTLSDNGIGRKLSGQHNKSKLKRENHESLGMEITVSRLKLLYPMATDLLKINDLYDAKGSALGTEVIIKLPLSTI